MSLTADNCKVIFLRLLWPTKYNLDPDILRLAATFKNEELSVWVKPTKPFSYQTRISQQGLKAENGELFFKGQMLKTTVDLKTALTRFYKFVTSSPGPVLLVTHSSGIELMLLFKAIRKFRMADMFEGVIQRVVDTVPIFEKRFPTLNGGSQLTLKVLVSYLQGKRFNEPPLDILYELRWLIRLVTENSVSTSELIENSKSYEQVLLRPPQYSPLFYNPLDIRDLSLTISGRTVRRLIQTEITLSKLKELSQKGSPMILHSYIYKQGAEKICRGFNMKTAEKIFHFLKKRRAHDHGDHSVNTAQGGVVDEPGSSITPHGEQHTDYSLLGTQNELIDDPDSIMEELETPNDSDHSCARQKAQCINYPSTGDQENPSNTLDSFVGEQRVSSYNDYVFSPGQEELIHAISLYSEAANDDPFPNQYDEHTNELNWYIERQEAPHNNDNSLTRQPQESVDDADFIMEETEAPYPSGRFLTTHEESRNAEVPLFNTERKAQYNADDSFVEGQEKLIDIMDLLREEQFDSNYPLNPGQEGAARAIDVYPEAQRVANYEPFLDLDSLVDQETPYDGTYSFGREQTEFVDDLNSVTEDPRALYDHSLTRRQVGREATGYSPFFGQYDELTNEQGQSDRGLNQEWNHEFDPFYYWRN